MTRDVPVSWITVMQEVTFLPSSCIPRRPTCKRYLTCSNRGSKQGSTIPQSWALVPAMQRSGSQIIELQFSFLSNSDRGEWRREGQRHTFPSCERGRIVSRNKN